MTVTQAAEDLGEPRRATPLPDGRTIALQRAADLAVERPRVSRTQSGAVRRLSANVADGRNDAGVVDDALGRVLLRAVREARPTGPRHDRDTTDPSTAFPDADASARAHLPPPMSTRRPSVPEVRRRALVVPFTPGPVTGLPEGRGEPARLAPSATPAALARARPAPSATIAAPPRALARPGPSPALVGLPSAADFVRPGAALPFPDSSVGRTTDSIPTPTRGARPPALLTTGPPSAVRPVAYLERAQGRRRALARAATWVRNVGLIVLVFLAYQLWGTGLEQHRSQAHLRAEFRAAQAAASGAGTNVQPASGQPPSGQPPSGQPPDGQPPARLTTLASNPTAAAPLPGGVVARLQIPDVHLDEYVVEGTDEADLRKGPGHYSGTPLPGQPGNVAIAGHRTTYGAPFNQLGHLQVGDSITATTVNGTFVYMVSQAPYAVLPGQTSVVDDYGDNRLTLTTCTPEFSASHRLIVVAKLQGRAPIARPQPVVGTAVVRPVAAAKPVVVADLKANAVGFNTSALPGVMIWIGALLLLALAYRPLRHRWPPLAAHALLVPLWIFSLTFLFEHLTGLLPANI